MNLDVGTILCGAFEETGVHQLPLAGCHITATQRTEPSYPNTVYRSPRLPAGAFSDRTCRDRPLCNGLATQLNSTHRRPRTSFRNDFWTVAVQVFIAERIWTFKQNIPPSLRPLTFNDDTGASLDYDGIVKRRCMSSADRQRKWRANMPQKCSRSNSPTCWWQWNARPQTTWSRRSTTPLRGSA